MAVHGKKLLIVAATEGEVTGVAEKCGMQQRAVHAGQLWAGGGADILVTGAGMVATAAVLAMYLCKNDNYRKYGLALNAGVAGCFNRETAPGTLLQVREDEIYRLGAEDGAGFISIEELGFGKFRYCEKPEQWVQDVMQEMGALPARGITVNTVHGNEENIAMVRRGPDELLAESMEGAAFMAACEAVGIKYMQLRAVSNYVERRNRAAWQLGKAIKCLEDALMQLIAQA